MIVARGIRNGGDRTIMDLDIIENGRLDSEVVVFIRPAYNGRLLASTSFGNFTFDPNDIEFVADALIRVAGHLRRSVRP